MSGPDHGRVDAGGRGSEDPGQMGPLLAGDTRPLGDEPTDAIRAGHEVAEIRATPAVRFLIGLALSAGLIFLLVWGLLAYWRQAANRSQPPQPALAASSRGKLPPEPRLQITPLEDYRLFEAAQESLLTSYGWVNRDSLKVRIPIERAMRLLAVKPGSEGTHSSMPHHGLPSRQVRESRPAGEDTVRSGRLPRGDLRLRPPAADVVPAPGPSRPDTAGHKGGGHR